VRHLNPVDRQEHESMVSRKMDGTQTDRFVPDHEASGGTMRFVCAVPSMTKGATIANVGVVARKRSRGRDRACPFIFT